jgi:hypothetical protein
VAVLVWEADDGVVGFGVGDGHGLGVAGALGAGSEDGPATDVVGVWNSLRTSISVGRTLGDAGSDGTRTDMAVVEKVKLAWAASGESTHNAQISL